jgi:hemin uptake protein HemP
VMKIITQLPAKEHMNFDVAIVAEQAPNCDIKLSRVKHFTTHQLFASAKEVMIEHLNEIYVLRITKQNKLILTK